MSSIQEIHLLCNPLQFSPNQGAYIEPPHTEAAIGETGTFYAWLPLSANGIWYVNYVSIACTSNVMDANCQCLGGACGEPQPSSHPVTLPVDTTLTFIWK